MQTDEAQAVGASLTKAKQRVRAAIRESRRARAAEARPAGSLTQHLIDLATEHHARRVSCFASTATEPDTSGFLEWTREHGIETLLPRSLPDGTLEWVLLGDEPLVTGAFGISEPVGSPIDAGARGVDPLSTCDLILIPAAAVDQRGTRLGWGRGYYDRSLIAARIGEPADRTPVYAVVFEDEVRETLPSEPHDVPVDGAVTEVQIHHFG